MFDVLIVGAGFAGLYAAKEVARLPVSLTVIDRKNHHTFQPLLYQVALAVLSPIAIKGSGNLVNKRLFYTPCLGPHLPPLAALTNRPACSLRTIQPRC